MTLTRYIGASAAVLGAIAVAAQANAADMYAGGGLKDAPVYAPAAMWTGFYFGANAGAAWSEIKTGRNIAEDLEGNTVAFGGRKASSTSPLGGAQLGYNWQTSGFVVGPELDLGGAGSDYSRTVFLNGLTNAAAVSAKSEGGFYGDITGRLGFTWGPALLYAKGGFAWLDTNFKASYVDALGTSYSWSHNNATLTGWTAGTGFEYMMSPNWTVKVEYLYFDFTNNTNTWGFDAANTWRLTDGNLTANTVKLGVNYLINHSYAPLK